VNDDLNADSRQLIAAYQAELQRRPSRPTSSWKAIERRIAAGEAPVPIDDDDDVVVATRRWRWLAVPLAAASIALVSIGWKTLRQAEQRSSVVAVPFESVTRVPRGEPRLEAPQAPALSSRARVRVTLAPAALEVLAPATSEEIRSSAPSSHSTATYETRNAAARQRATVRSTRHRRTRPASADVVPESSGKVNASTIEDEAALLAKGRTALRDGRPGDALTYVTEHARLFPQGSLAQERAMLKVAARCEAGDRETARSDAQEFVRRYPASPLRARVLALCAKDTRVQ